MGSTCEWRASRSTIARIRPRVLRENAGTPRLLFDPKHGRCTISKMGKIGMLDKKEREMDDLRSKRIERVVLVNPPMRMEKVYGSYSAWGSVSPPTGLCYIAALLRQNGLDVSIWDAEALGVGQEETVRAIQERRPDIVGIACKTLWIESAHRVAQMLKEKMPDVPVVGGGNHVTAMPERTFKEYPSFDILVLGEGEVTFLELIRALNEGKDLHEVAGLALREAGGTVRTAPRERIRDLDSLPFPAFDLLPNLAAHYKPPLTSVEKLPAFSLVGSRGCPCKCTFCDRGVFQNRVTHHGPQYMVSLIKDLHDKHGIRYLMFDDDNLLLNKNYLFQLLDLLEGTGLRIPFSCQSRVDTIDEEKVDRLKRARCRMIQFGIESGSQKMLDAMKKGITVEQIRTAIALTRKARIRAAGFFIVGYPGETRETLEETVSLIRECKFDDVGVFLFTPLPGSEVYGTVSNYGHYEENWSKTNALDQVVFVPHSLSPEVLKEYSDRCYKACYFRAGQLIALLKRCTSKAYVRALARSIPMLWAKQG